jgi:hypothetical protein
LIREKCHSAKHPGKFHELHQFASTFLLDQFVLIHCKVGYQPYCNVQPPYFPEAAGPDFYHKKNKFFEDGQVDQQVAQGTAPAKNQHRKKEKKRELFDYGNRVTNKKSNKPLPPNKASQTVWMKKKENPKKLTGGSGKQGKYRATNRPSSNTKKSVANNGPFATAYSTDYPLNSGTIFFR